MDATIKFIPVKHMDQVNLGDIGLFGVSGSHKFLGFKPGVGRSGWLVVAVNDHQKTRRPRKRRK